MKNKQDKKRIRWRERGRERQSERDGEREREESIEKDNKGEDIDIEKKRGCDDSPGCSGERVRRG